MLNVKYIVFDKAINQPGLLPIYNGANSFLYLNQNVLPRAYFVNRIEKKPALEILNIVKNNQFDPLDIAFSEKEIPNIDQPDSTAFVNITSFEDERIEIDVNASGNNFLFLGDTYFPKGWSATVDGTETEIFRTNHGFRGIVVPSGKHKVVFSYLPDSFVMSKYVSLSLSSIVVLLLIGGLIRSSRQKKLAANN